MSLARQSGGKRDEAAQPEHLTEAWAASVLPRREPGAHKWGVGGVVVVAGSPPFSGAAALACAGAGRSGAGIVSAALPRSIVQVVVGLVPEVTVVILPEGDSASVARRAAAAILERLQRSRAIVVGPGLGDDEATASLLGSLFGFSRAQGAIGFGGDTGAEAADNAQNLVDASKPAVVDADALNWLSKQARWWERVPRDTLVLTPHAGEMARLTGKETDEILANPGPAARDAALLWGQTVVLKGAQTLVVDADGRMRSVETPTALATAGSGDVMSGSIGAFLAQGLCPADAAALAVFAGSRAAATLAQRLGELGVVAGDLPVAIAEELAAIGRVGE